MILPNSAPVKRNLLVVSLLVATVFVYYYQQRITALRSSFRHEPALSTPEREEELPLPADYFNPIRPSEFCDNIYGLSYLKKYRDSRQNYCEQSQSISDLTCFQKPNHKGRLEPFCVAGHVLYNPSKDKKRRFHINCELRDLPREGPDRALRIEEFPEHFAHSGPGVLLTDYFDISNSTHEIDPQSKAALQRCAGRPKSNQYTILLKRDHTAPNHHWHSLWEIYSFYLSMDILQMSPRPGTNQPFFTPEDVRNAQIVVIDNKEMGMMEELWGLWAKKPPVHLKDFSPEEPLCLDNVLLPIAGSANPIWAGDWWKRNCTESKLVDAFVKRALGVYNVTHPVDDEKNDRPLRMTIVSREKGRRRIKDRAKLAAGIRRRWPNVEVNEVNFGDFPYGEQVRIVANSDIMIGTHGAGMALQLFLPPRSSVVEIKPYNFTYWGFRNMAKIRNTPYFTIHAEYDPNDKDGWQKIEEITLDETKFNAAVDAAIHAVQQRGYLGADIA